MLEGKGESNQLPVKKAAAKKTAAKAKSKTVVKAAAKKPAAGGKEKASAKAKTK
jgi:hypothetical protein